MARRPTLYAPRRGVGRHATWLELFFDLVFVLAIAELARYLHDHLTVGGFLGFGFLFLPVWLVWSNFSYHADLFDADGPVYRVAMLTAMLFSIALAVNVHGALDGSSAGFAAAYVALRVLLVGLYAWAWRYVEETRALAAWHLAGFSAGALIWSASLLVAEPARYWVWALGLLVEMSTPIFAQFLVLEDAPVQMSHLPERFGLFTIVVLGESILVTGVGVAGTEWAAGSVAVAVLGFAAVGCLWWLYFDHVVDEFALSYAARFESVPERILYCEHGNQFDPANTIKDYEDPLDTPLGDHIVTDLTRGIVAAGRITRSLDLRDLNKVYPLVTIPEWVVGRFFYDLLGRVVTYLLLPLIIGYAAYWIVEYLLTVAHDDQVSWLQTLLAEIATDAFLLVVAFGLFYLAVRRTAARAVSSVSSRLPGHRQGTPAPHVPEQEIRGLLATDQRPPMKPDLPGREIDVFVSGHTHAPSLSEIRREDGEAAIIVNSGCWLRQLQPVRAHFRGPPVFVPKFVQTHVRVFLGGSSVRVELWEHPKPARVHLRAAERIAILGRLPAQPAEEAEARVQASRELQGAG